jgi:hypothetical protein
MRSDGIGDIVILPMRLEWGGWFEISYGGEELEIGDVGTGNKRPKLNQLAMSVRSKPINSLVGKIVSWQASLVT